MCNNNRRNYSQKVVDAHANALLNLEFQAGETVAVWMPDGADKVLLYDC